MEARQRQTGYKRRVEAGRENQSPVKQSRVRAGREGSATINNPQVKLRRIILRIATNSKTGAVSE